VKNPQRVVGRRIVSVERRTIPADRGASRSACWETVALVLDDGAVIRFSVHETESEYAVEAYRVEKNSRPSASLGHE
jgi:hypothetical protein